MRSSRVPPARTPFIGRAHDLQELEGVLARGTRLVTITGVGGMGKTRLAAEIGRRAEHQGRTVIYCDVAKMVSAEGLDLAVLRALRPEESMEAITDRRSSILEQLYATGPTLLILDAAEALANELTPRLDEWLDASDSLVALVTSHHPLGMEGEHVHPLSPLALEDARALFKARSLNMGAEASTLDDETLDRTVEGLGRIPLAVELGASRLGSLFGTPSETGSSSPLNARMSEALSRSWRSLSASEQALLRLVSTFLGAFSSTDAVRMAPAEVRPELSSAFDGGLTRGWIAVKQEEGSARYVLLDPIRAYIASILDPSQKTEVALAHARYCAEAAESASLLHERYGDREQSLILDRLWQETEIAAVRCAEVDPAVAARALVAFPARRWVSFATPRRIALAKSLSTHTSLPAHVRTKLAIATGVLAAWSETQPSENGGNDPFAGSDQWPISRVEIATWTRSYATMVGMRGDYRAAIDFTLRAAAILDEEDAPYARSYTYTLLGRLAKHHGDMTRAEHCALTAVASARQCNADALELDALTDLVDQAASRGDVAAVNELIARGGAIRQDEVDVRIRVFWVVATSLVGLWLGTPDVARERIRRRLPAVLEDVPSVGWRLASATIGWIQLDLGHRIEARTALVEALDDRRLSSTSDIDPAIVASLGLVHASLGAFGLCRQIYADLESDPRASEPRIVGTIALLRALSWWIMAMGEARVDQQAEAKRQTAQELDRVLRDRRHQFVPLVERIAERWVRAALSGTAAFLGAPQEPTRRRQLWISQRSGTFRVDDGAAVSLEGHPLLQRLLFALVNERAPGGTGSIPRDALIQKGWPDERILVDAARVRLRVAIRRLRALGLEEILITTGDGYALHPDLMISHLDA